MKRVFTVLALLTLFLTSINFAQVSGVPTRYIVTASTFSPTPNYTVIITAQLVDGFDDPVLTPGLTVTWSKTNINGSFSNGTSTTDGNGVATISFYAHTVAGTTTQIIATDNSAPTNLSGTSATITTIAGTGNRYLVTSSNYGPVAGAGVTISAQFTDTYSNPVNTPTARTVTWYKSNGNGSFATASSTTNASGLATVVFTTHTVSGTATTVTGTDVQTRTGTSSTITTVAGPATKYIVTPGSVSPVAGSGVTVTAQLADFYNNSVTTSGLTVTWSKDNPNGSFTPATSSTVNGLATVTFNTHTVAGTSAAVTATDNSMPTNLEGTSATITTTVGPAAKYIVTPGSLNPVAGSGVTVNAQLADANNNYLNTSGLTVTWSKNNPNGSFTPATSSTVNGLATVTFNTHTVAGTAAAVTATDNSAPTNLTGTTATITTVAGAGTKYLITSSSAPVAGSVITISAQFVDANNNPVATPAPRTITWSKSDSHGLFSSGTSTTNGSGLATVDFTTYTVAGTGTTISVNDGTYSGGPSSAITTVAGPGIKYLVTSSDYAPAAGTDVTISAQFADVNNNPVTTPAPIVVTWTKSDLTHGTFASSTSSTNGSGLATVLFTTHSVSGTSTTVTGTDGSGYNGTTPIITTGPAAGTKFLVTSSSYNPAAGSTVTISAQFVNNSNTPVATPVPLTVTWSKSDGNGAFASPTCTTDANGLATVVFTTHTVVGTTTTITGTDGTGKFGISSNITTTAVTIGPANYVVGVSILPTFSWAPVPGATGYTLEVSTSPSFATLITLAGSTNIPGITYTVGEANRLNSSTVYYWRVLALGVGTYSPVREFTTFSSVITISNIYPADDGRSASVGWYITPATNNVVYDLYYARSADLLTDPHQITNIKTNSTTIPGLTHGNTYYFLVRARNSAGTVIMNYTAVQSFTTPGLPTPTLSYPLAADEAIYSKPVLYWYTEGYDATFEYEIKYWKTTIGQPADGAYIGQGVDAGYFATGSPNTYNVLTETLTPGSTYNWKVRTKKGSLYSATWSDPSTFRIYSTVPTSPITPTPSWPINNVSLFINPPQVYWYLGTYATGLYFQVEWSKDNFGSVLGTSPDINNDLFYILPSNLDAGTYQWRVRSKVGSGGTWSVTWSSYGSFKIPSVIGQVTTPIQTMPVGQVPTLTPTFKWYAPSSPAMEYKIKISTYSDTDPVTGMLTHPATVTSSAWITGTTSTFAGLNLGTFVLESGSTYYWQVQAQLVSDHSTKSSWSYISTFTTATGATAIVPVVGSPNHGQPIDNTSAMLSWILPVQTGTHLKYDVEYSKTIDFKNSQSVKNVNEPLVNIKGLDPNSSYYWRVASKNNLSNLVSNYSEIGLFNTGKVTAIENETLPTEFSLSQNYPNPFNPTTVINYALPQNSFVTLKVYDLLGREVKTLINQEVSAGRNSVQWNGDDNFGSKVATGVYVYRIMVNNSSVVSEQNFISTKKMLLIK